MRIQFILNGRKTDADIDADLTLYSLLRDKGCLSVKCGCETANCGLCTVLLDGKSVLSCSVPAGRVDGREVYTLEGLQSEAEEIGCFLAEEGGEQCGFCSPGFIVNVIALGNEIPEPTEEEIKEYMAGNLCRCSGYMSQMRALTKYFQYKKGER
ncbi:MAG: 2Fe-2S iron-sulfur cluster-binding protein [bacterium]|nr:2Fe-2S iron-sulfur cluster-binding protein [bacterium]